MAPKKKHSEGIALLSVYSDEDDEEMEEAEEEEEEEGRRHEEEQENEYREASNMEEERGGGGGGEEYSRTPGAIEGNSTVHGTPRSHENEGLSNPNATNQMVVDSEGAEIEGAGDVSGENTDALDKFLPPPPKEKCSEELQRRIDKFLNLKKIGRSFNAEVRNRKDYRNPDFLLHAVRYQDIDQIGSCFSKDVFDPHGYDRSDYYDEIEVDMKRERVRKEHESKKNQKLDFVSGGTQSGVVPAPQKPTIPIPGIQALAASGLPSLSATTDAATGDGRSKKKSKWDKVDGDVKNPLPSGAQDSLSSIRANAALLTAATAGSGYTAFVQQRRREAEERRSMERKLERRS